MPDFGGDVCFQCNTCSNLSMAWLLLSCVPWSCCRVDALMQAILHECTPASTDGCMVLACSSRRTHHSHSQSNVQSPTQAQHSLHPRTLHRLDSNMSTCFMLGTHKKTVLAPLEVRATHLPCCTSVDPSIPCCGGHRAERTSGKRHPTCIITTCKSVGRACTCDAGLWQHPDARACPALGRGGLGGVSGVLRWCSARVPNVGDPHQATRK
jgi:hypothetical protein